MRWEFDSAGEWEAKSHRLDEDDQNYIWRIQVCDDGTFSVSDSDWELTEHKETFATLKEAKDFCESIEGRVIVQTSPSVVEIPRSKYNLKIDDPLTQGIPAQPSLGAWFDKTVESMAENDVRRVMTGQHCTTCQKPDGTPTDVRKLLGKCDKCRDADYRQAGEELGKLYAEAVHAQIIQEFRK
jgi:hypothetical protein